MLLFQLFMILSILTNHFCIQIQRYLNSTLLLSSVMGITDYENENSISKLSGIAFWTITTPTGRGLKFVINIRPQDACNFSSVYIQKNINMLFCARRLEQAVWHESLSENKKWSWPWTAQYNPTYHRVISYNKNISYPIYYTTVRR
jgi:hypothetical protein